MCVNNEHVMEVNRDMESIEKRSAHAYPIEKRVQAITLFEAGTTPFQVAKEVGVSSSLAYVWRDLYAQGVLNEISYSPKKYDVETKHQVVMEALAGIPLADVIAKYSLSGQPLIDSWVRRYQAEGIEGLKEKKRGRPRKNAA